MSDPVVSSPEGSPLVAAARKIVHSHWRPIGGWICIAAIGYELVLLPILATILNILMMPKAEVVHVDKVLLLELVGIFVTYRSFDKYHGVDTK